MIYSDHDRGDSRSIAHSAQAKSMAAGDYDRDGYPDILVSGWSVDASGNSTAHSAIYRNNDGDGTFTLAVTFDNVIGNCAFADLNNDGWLEVVLAGRSTDGSNYGRVYINNGDGSFTNMNSSYLPLFTSTRNGGLAVADFNKDGYLDVLVNGWGDQWYVSAWSQNIWFNSQNDSYLFPYPTDCSSFGLDGKESLQIYVRDYNNDGWLDVLQDGQDESRIWYGASQYRFNSLNGTVETQLRERNSYETHDARRCVGDIDGDGLTDQFHANYLWCDGSIASTLGSSDGWGYTASIFNNANTNKPAKPNQPSDIKAGYIDGKLFVSWKDTNSNDPFIAYNVVFCYPNGQVQSLIPCDATENGTGFLRVAEGKEVAVRPGVQYYEIDHDPSKFEASAQTAAYDGPYVDSMGLTAKGYKVGVQAVSLATETYSAIKFADEVTGIDNIVNDYADEIEMLNVVVDGNNVTVNAAAEQAVTIYDTLGRTIATGYTNQAIAVPATGILIVNSGTTSAKIKI